MTKNIVIGVLVAAMLLFGFLVFGGSSALFGSSTGPQHYQRETFLQGFQVSQKGTEQSNQVTKTCSILADNSITASSTGYAYCLGVTGVTSADNIVAMFSTSTLGWRAYLDNIEIISAKASTTAGAIDFELYNGTGATQAPSAANRTGSTTVIWAAH